MLCNPWPGSQLWSGFKARKGIVCRNGTHALGAIASVSTVLLIITPLAAVTADLCDVLVCLLMIEEGVGLQRHDGKDKSLRDLHLEFMDGKNEYGLLIKECLEMNGAVND